MGFSSNDAGDGPPYGQSVEQPRLTFAVPNALDRFMQPAARRAYFSIIIEEYRRRFADVPLEERPWNILAMCLTCGTNTGTWCDDCEAAGWTYQDENGNVLVGSPICNHCDRDPEVECEGCAFRRRNPHRRGQQPDRPPWVQVDPGSVRAPVVIHAQDLHGPEFQQ